MSAAAAYTAVDVPQSEAEALQAIYNSTYGAEWNWRPDSYGLRWNFSTVTVDPCSGWQGVTCGSVSGDPLLHVFNITLPSYNMTGSLPNQIADLIYLDFLDLDYNLIGGKLPIGLCNLTKLEKFSIRDNFLMGAIPPCLQTNLTYLYSLSLHGNSLHGSIPEFGLLSHLRYLSYSSNYLTGTLPASIQFLPNLAVVFLTHNQLHGPIDLMANLSAARQLSLSYNIFSTTIPASYAQLTQLEYLYLEDNLLYGSLPDNFGSMSQLIYLILFGNLLTGPLPQSMGNLTRIIELSLDVNYFSGTLSNSIVGNWKRVEQANLYTNLFSGSLPPAFSTLSKMSVMLVQQNMLTGSLQEAFNTSRQVVLQAVDVSANKFTGTIPDSIFGGNLTTFVAYDCCFSGRIPASICQAQQLVTLVLDGLTNACSHRIWPDVPSSPRIARPVPGTIPACIWTDLRNLTTLHVSGNGLSGTIPQLQSYGQLTDLELSFNSLTGSIPSSLQQWSMLQTLNLESNKLLGTIEDMQDLTYGYSSATDGVKVSLSTNRLSGVIPRAMEYANWINIVEGNLFSCSDAHEPPYSDPNSSNFTCGSNMVDIALQIFAIVGGFVVLAALAGFYFISASYGAKQKASGGDNNWVRSWQEVGHLIAHHRHDEIQQLLKQRDCASTSRLEQAKIFSLQILLWHSKLMHMVDQNAAEPRLANLVQFIWSLQCLCRISIILMVLSVVLGIPMYAVLKEYYRTYAKQFRWEPSGVFLSGYQPAIAIILFWAVSLYITMYLIVINIPLSTSSHSDKGIELQRYLTKTPVSSTSDELSRTFTIMSGIKSTIQRVSDTSIWMAFSLLFVNIIIIMALKGAFIYFLVTSSTTYAVKMLMTVLLGGVDVFWGSVLVPFMINRLPGVKSAGKMVVKLCTVFVNSIFSSVVAISLADASCFQGLFVAQPKASEDYNIQYCAYYSLNTTECNSALYTFAATASYTPTFYYNYNCYSTVVTEYVPIFFLSYCFLALMIPLGSMVAAHSQYAKMLAAFYPAIFWADTQPLDKADAANSRKAPDSVDPERQGSIHRTLSSKSDAAACYHGQSDTTSTDEVVSELHISTVGNQPSGSMQVLQPASTSRLLFPAFILAAGVHHVVVMLTFGLFYPPLNVLVCLLVCVTAFTWETLIGRWLMAGEENDKVYISPSMLQLNEVCASVCCAPRRGLGLLSLGSGVFVGLACWDIAGDTLGWQAALWAPLGAMAISLCLHLSFQHSHSYRERQGEDPQVRESEQMEQERDQAANGSFASDYSNVIRGSSLWKRMASHSQSSSTPSFPSSFFSSPNRQGRAESSVEMSAGLTHAIQSTGGPTEQT
ncbi:hypothetical protein EON64_03140 [archaeon]|nr:MAG: hypothetical protein EON64_03140 [archaeon]